MASDTLSLTIDKTQNIPLVLGGTNSFTISIRNINPTIRLYNLSLFISLPDGLSISTATFPQTSKIVNTDGSSKYSWISLKDLAPMEVSYLFNVTVKSNTKFKNGSTIPFGYVFTGISVKCEVDTMPRGDNDIGNKKITEEVAMTFKATRFLGTISTSGKVLKGAGTSLSLNDYTKVYTATCKFSNNSIVSSTVNISILLENGIRYLSNISTSGTDGASFSMPIVSSVTIDNKQYLQLYFGSVILSPGSNTTLTFNYAVWNQYNNNTEGLLYHGTKLQMLINISSMDDTVTDSTSFSAMDIIISTSINKSLVDVQDVVQYSYTYQVGQYYDIKDIIVDYLLPDGISYLSSSVNPDSVIDTPSLKGYKITYTFPLAIKNSENTIKIGAKVDDFYRYKLNDDTSPKPVVSFDNFKANGNIIGTTLQLLSTVSDNANVSSTISVATIKKEFLKGYYRNGVSKTSTALAPGDLAEYKLTYDSNNLKAIQKQIYIDDFFPLSSDPIDNLLYTFTGYKPPSLIPKPIDPHGIDFYYGDVPGKILSTIIFKVPIKLLGSSSQNINLMKIKGINTDGYSYSNRTQVLINIGTPNLQLTKSVTGANKNAIKFGEVYIYTVTISNTNTLGTESDAFNFILTDNLSSWFTVNPSTIKITGTGSYSSFTIDASTIKIPITKLAPGQSLTLSYSVTISDFIAPGLTIATTASNTNPYSQQYDETLDNFQYTNQNKTATVTIYSPNITITKTNNVTLFKVNSDITYTIILTIPQGTTAYNVYVKDTLPNGGQIYSNSAFRNGVPITPSILNNIITLPNEGTIDARSSVQVITYTINCKITNATKSINAITSTQTNTCQVIYKQKSDGNTITISKSLSITINHPNILMNLTAKDIQSSILYTENAVINTNSIMEFKLTFLNNSSINLINGIIEIPINNNFVFSSINTTMNCTATYNSISGKIIIVLPTLDSSISGYVTFTLIPLSTLRSGTSISTEATATQYYNDISTKLYSGEKSNNFICILPPGTSLLPSASDRINDSTSFRVTQPGFVATIINIFQNIGGGYDDYTLLIAPVGIDYTLYINDQKIIDVSKNTPYQADLNIMKNIAPYEMRTITILATIPKDSPLGSRFDFIVTAKSKTTPYPEKTVLNIDPS